MNLREVANTLPDLPRWVEVRSMLLADRAEVFGLDLAAAPSFVAVHADGGLMGIVGMPRPAAIHDAIRSSGNVDSVLAIPEDAAWVEHVLTDWSHERAVLHVLPDPSRLPSVPQGTVRLLAPSDIVALESLPTELKKELEAESRAGTAIAAAFEDGQPVSFCYAGSETERWWDIGIDTLEPYRRKGLAARCVAFQIARFRERGKQPVWGATDSNSASVQLAAKLGFMKTDEICVFTPPASS
ncbi:MAG: GNAT family N-acetyltransferase [Gemmatimonadaceae bacterium]